MQTRRIIILIIIGVIIVITAVFLFKMSLPIKEGAEGEGPIEGVEEGGVTPTRQEVPEDIVVPEIGTEVKEDVAVPQTVSEAAPGVEAKFRRFEVKAENNSYSPSTVIVNQDDTVHIDFIAVDKKYDFVFPDYGMRQIAEAGETKIIEFQAVERGKFLFYSNLYGGLEGEMKGYIIVK